MRAGVILSVLSKSKVLTVVQTTFGYCSCKASGVAAHPPSIRAVAFIAPVKRCKRVMCGEEEAFQTVPDHWTLPCGSVMVTFMAPGHNVGHDGE